MVVLLNDFNKLKGDIMLLEMRNLIAYKFLSDSNTRLEWLASDMPMIQNFAISLTIFLILIKKLYSRYMLVCIHSFSLDCFNLKIRVETITERYLQDFMYLNENVCIDYERNCYIFY